MKRTAVVTGASSGIGAATVRRLISEGFQVVAAARRTERIELLAAETGARAITCDVTSQSSVEDLTATVANEFGNCHVLVNNAGGAFGLDPVSTASTGDWQRMYDVNVIGLLRMTRALLPQLIASGAGHVVNVTSLAAHQVYEKAAGYAAAKQAAAAVNDTLRLELVAEPVRITEVAPGMVRTEEFSLVRFGGDQQAADAVYQGVPEPLTADDVADCISWAVTRPAHVNIDRIDVQPRVQAAYYKIHREG